MPVTSSIAEVQSRISEIQSRIAGVSKNTSGAFADTLANVLGASGISTTPGYPGNGPTNTGTVRGDDVVASAKKYLGVPYVYGGNNPTTGLDCSSLVQQAYRDLGIQLPRVAADQARQGTAVASLAQAKPGDLVAFGSPVDHIGIYMGDNKMVVAPRRGEVVKIQDVYKTPTAIRRIIPDNDGYMNIAGQSVGIASTLRSQFDSLFTAAGSKYGISANLLAAVAKQESGFNPRAGSSAGAQGLMQFMPATAKGLGVNPYDPASAVDGAARMLSGLKDRFGSIELALAAYNAGSGNVQKYNGIPPFRETQNYVKNVMAMASQAR